VEEFEILESQEQEELNNKKNEIYMQQKQEMIVWNTLTNQL